jgi:hypothetical protein
MVVVTIVGVLLGVCAGLIHLLLKLDRGGRSSHELASDMARLATDFRVDAHAATAVDRMTLKLDAGQTVEYLVRPDDIVRTLRERDKVRHHDLYRRPSGASVRIEVGREGPASIATLIIDRPLDGREDSLYRDYRIDAELGKWQRLDGRPR